MMMRVTVNTPKKQAAACMKTQKKAYLGFTAAKKIVKEEIVNDSQFYWVLDLEEKDLKALYKNAARGEIIIKKFYSTLFKVINRCNVLQAKFQKGAKWIKKQLIKRLGKLTENSPDDNNGLISSLEKMTDKELGEFITINDKAAMDKLLSGELIIISEEYETIPK